MCEALGYPEKSRSVILRKLSDSENGLYPIQTVNRGTQNLSVVSEPGLYKLIMRSDRPEARKFSDWVTSVVLPAIRKDGAYVMGEEKVLTGKMSSKSDSTRFAERAKLMGWTPPFVCARNALWSSLAWGSGLQPNERSPT